MKATPLKLNPPFSVILRIRDWAGSLCVVFCRGVLVGCFALPVTESTAGVCHELLEVNPPGWGRMVGLQVLVESCALVSSSSLDLFPRLRGIVQKVFSEKASAMRQKCVRNASKWVLVLGGTFQNARRNASKLRQKCVKSARNTFGENTFWTIRSWENTMQITLPKKNQKFRKGVGGQRGLAQGDPSHARHSHLFAVPFSYATLRRRGTQFWGSIFAVFWALLVANPLPPTPFRNLRQPRESFEVTPHFSIITSIFYFFRIN